MKSDIAAPALRPPRYIRYYRQFWLRPEAPAIPTIRRTNPSLLQTCRGTYLETRHLRAISSILHLWRTPSSSCLSMAPLYCRFTPEQQNRITLANRHYPGSLSLLSSHLWNACVHPPNLLHRIEHLRISAAELHIDYANAWYNFSSRSCGGDRYKDEESTEGYGHGEPPQESPDAEWRPSLQWCNGIWPEAFRRLPNLKRVTIDFDEYPDERQSMGKLVEWASRVWLIPLGPRRDHFMYLSARGNPVRKTSWRAPIYCRPLTVHDRDTDWGG